VNEDFDPKLVEAVGRIVALAKTLSEVEIDELFEVDSAQMLALIERKDRELSAAAREAN